MNKNKSNTYTNKLSKKEDIRYCTNCGNKINIEDGEKFCSKCGKEVINVSKSIECNSKSNIPNVKFNKKYVIILIILFIILCIMIGLIKEADKTLDTSYSIINSYVSSEEAPKVKEIIEKCGFTNYIVTRDESIDGLWEEGTLGFRIKSDQSNNATLYVKNGCVDNIRYADIDLYKNGEYLDSASNYYVSFNEKINWMTKAESGVNQLLKAPSTAKYPLANEWNIYKNQDTVTIESYVDSQNSFGAMIRSNFKITVINNQVTSLIFDGKEYIK